MMRHIGVAGIAVSASMIVGCGAELGGLFLDSGDVVRVYLVNTSTSKYVSPNPGICPQGIEATTSHRFLDEPPIIEPGRAVSYTTQQIAGSGGVCANADPSFSVGLCGWKYGDSPDNLTLQAEKFGGQIGYQFGCGDTVILRWADTGPACGTWSSEVMTAPNNPLPTAPFMTIGTGGVCTGF